jgi:PIN domain nuclease of toxin-antitoxin system
VRLLLDTQILVWLPAADRRLKPTVADTILADESELYVSAVTACEFTELRTRRRIAAPYDIAGLADQFGFEILDLPAGVWADLAALPVLHRDPADRMLISHARLSGLSLVTADATIRRYPVETFW